MSNSPLVNHVHLSPNYTSMQNKKNEAIVIHHMAGKLTVEQCGNVFAPSSRKASSNYAVDNDGRIGMYVEEKNRSWATSSKTIDSRAITIEVANSSTGGNWPVSEKALASLINLCVDICKRNGIKKLVYTGDKTGNLHMHKWYAATSCPGPYLESKFPYIANEVNKRLNGSTSQPNMTTGKMYRVRKSWSDAETQKGAFTNLDNAKKCADKNAGYKVYDETGTVVYSGKSSSASSSSFLVQVDINDLYIRKGPGTNYPTNGFTGKGRFTIVETKNGWGRLKSGAGWISLNYAKRI